MKVLLPLAAVLLVQAPGASRNPALGSAATADAPGPAVGTTLPAFTAPDQDGRPRTFESLRGPNGLLLIFSRSTDWCPYCKSQLIEIDGQLESFRKQGLEVAALTYDSVAVVKDFATRRKIRYPLLADPESVIIRRFGLLDPEHAPGTLSYGVPLPTIFETDARGVIRAKYFEGQQRRTGASILLMRGAVDGKGTTELRTPHFTLRTSASNTEVVPGNVVTLALDFDLQPGHHAYAPGVKGYRPLALRLDPQPVATYLAPVFPPSRPYVFAPLKETVPVFEGKFRILQDVSLSSTVPEMGTLVRSAKPTLTVSGTLSYQVCSETICYPPAELRVQWTFTVRRADTEQVPEALRRKPSTP